MHVIIFHIQAENEIYEGVILLLNKKLNLLNLNRNYISQTSMQKIIRFHMISPQQLIICRHTNISAGNKISSIGIKLLTKTDMGDLKVLSLK